MRRPRKKKAKKSVRGMSYSIDCAFIWSNGAFISITCWLGWGEEDADLIEL